MSQRPILSTENVVVAIDGKRIVDGVTFSAGSAEWIGIIGPNGSGKTTLLRALNGFVPFSGHVAIKGRDIRQWPRRELATCMSFVRQTHNLAFDFSVEELVGMGRTPYLRWLDGLGAPDSGEVSVALERVKLAGFEGRNVLSLSGGELQRVFLAQTLVQNTEIVLLDEPTTHLDIYQQYEFLDHVRGLAHTGKTIVSVFHDLEQAARYSDRLLVLDNGRQVAFEEPEAALTPALIEKVFSMKARVRAGSDGFSTIAYLRPVRRDATPGGSNGHSRK